MTRMHRRSAAVLALLLAAGGCAAPTAEDRSSTPAAEAPPPPRPAPSLVGKGSRTARTAPAQGAAPAAGTPARDGAAPDAPAGADSTPAASAPASSAQDPTGASGTDTAPAGQGALVLGTVAGETLTASDVLEAWHAVSPSDLRLVVDKLVATRLARAEAGRLGIRLAPDLVEREVKKERDRLEKQIDSVAPGTEVAAFLTQRLGVDPQRYLQSMRAATLERMITERAVRAWTLTQENRAVRVLVVKKEDAEEVQGLLSKGGDLEALARERSLDDTKERGGYVPYLVKTGGSALALEAFDADPGVVVGPLASGDLRLFLRVESVRAPLTGGWDTLGPAVEGSLEQEQVLDSEYVPWKLAMERTWPVDLTPLADLVGDAR